jgi:site-specific DNA-cytosine methylase
MENTALDRAPVWDDLTTFDGRPWRGLVDIIHGGYPCQPFSVAGKKLGDKDPRHLWPHVARIVSEIQPALCFFENVGGHLRLGFEQVHDDLRSMGYRVKAGLFTAEEIGATHKRERLFMLAYREGDGRGRRLCLGRNVETENGGRAASEFTRSGQSSLANTESAGKLRGSGDLHQTQCRPDGSLFRIAHGTDDNLVADRHGDRCECHPRPSTGKDDPQRRPERIANAVAGGNCSATQQFPIHETGFNAGASRPPLSCSESSQGRPMADTTGERTWQQRTDTRSGVTGNCHEPMGNADCAGSKGKSGAR